VGKTSPIDLLKGVLMLLVMVGHAMEISGQSHLALWIGAGFRMPLMIGISGYLLNLPRTRDAASADLFRRYGARMLLPWATAVAVHVLATGYPLGWSAPLDLLLRPPFHLWYVPVLLFLILATRVIRLSPLALLVMGVPVSLLTMYGFGLDHGPIGGTLLAPDSRYMRYPVYFFFGMLMAERGLPRRYLGVTLLLAALGIVWWSALRGSGNGLAFVPARMTMCLGLIALLPQVAALPLSIAPLERIGRDSLFFYLWHPLMMGAVLMTGAGPLSTVILSALLLAVLSRITGGNRALRRWTGSAAPARGTEIATPPVAAPAPAI
jgi:fucose 4-O-acetylase-like acetyltransferase